MVDNTSASLGPFSNYGRHSPFRRAAYSVIMIASILLVGTILFHYLEHYSYVDAFYFMSMLATAEGPATVPVTVAGKLLAAFMSFISIGTVVFALGYLFGPFFWKLLHTTEVGLKKEENTLKEDIHKAEKKL